MLDTLRLEILRTPPDSSRWPDATPLLFVHGSFSAAWVWREHFMPWFAERGRPSAALSLRGHGGSGGDLHASGLADYVEDLGRAVDEMPRPPIIIGHSLGGLVVQKYLQNHPETVAGMVLMASVPPSGLLYSAFHMAMVAPDLLWQLHLLQTMGPQACSPHAMFRALFSDATDPAAVMKYVPHLQQESRRVNSEVLLPGLMPLPRDRVPPTLVMGGDRDVFLPTAAFRETATFWFGEFALLPGLPHGLMLDATWEQAALRLDQWLAANRL